MRRQKAYIGSVLFASSLLILASCPWRANAGEAANLAKADGSIDQSIPLSPQTEDNLQSEADGLYSQGKYKEALPLYFRLTEQNGTGRGICDSPITLHHLSDLADCYARLDQYDKAQRLYERILVNRIHQRGRNSLEAAVDTTNVAACYYNLQQYKKAENLCEKAVEVLNKSDTTRPNLAARACLELGEVYYAEAKYDNALRAYSRAAKLYDESRGDIVEPLLLALQGDAACLYRDKQYTEAIPVLERIAEIQATMHGSTDVRYGWALLNLSDVYRKVGQPDKANSTYAGCVQIFRKVNIERILSEQGSKGTLTDKEMNRIYKHMFGYIENESLDDVRAAVEANIARHHKSTGLMKCLPSEKSLAKPGPWNLVTSNQIDPPVWLWMDPRIHRRATLVCVHGLGLNSRTYENFARAIAPRGFCTLAADMRGFGTYATSKGKERADFDGSIEDLRSILKTVRAENSKVPIFILGESMGGAIALQFTAKYPELVDGLICSVPAGTRYKMKKTELKVFVRLLKGVNKPFNIGKEVISQATANDSLQKAWENDPFNRLELTPKELVDFQRFMNQNKAAASKIKDRPVIFFQGGQDKLVKAKGTVDIFKDVASTDKDLVFIGSSEHLIFEEGQFDPSVVYGVIGWMLAHIPDTDNTMATK
jgi:alpha-beta hydrolase superfamily lysophospholipase